MIDLKHGDCLELMKDIPSGSVEWQFSAEKKIWELLIEKGLIKRLT